MQHSVKELNLSVCFYDLCRFIRGYLNTTKFTSHLKRCWNIIFCFFSWQVGASYRKHFPPSAKNSSTSQERKNESEWFQTEIKILGNLVEWSWCCSWAGWCIYRWKSSTGSTQFKLEILEFAVIIAMSTKACICNNVNLMSQGLFN